MKKIAGGLNLAFSISILGLIIYNLAFENTVWYESVSMLFISIMPLAGVYYTVTTRFWTDKTLIERDLDKENIIIKKRIERLELLKKLSDIEAKSND